MFYYALKAKGKGPPGYSDLKNEDALLQYVEELVKEYQALDYGGVFVYSERKALAYYGIFGIKPDDPRWQKIKDQLAGDNGENILFSNEYVHIYANPGVSIRSE